MRFLFEVFVVYFICAFTAAKCLSLAVDLCNNMTLSKEYKGQDWRFSSIHRMNEEGSKFMIYCEKKGAVGYMKEDK